MAFFDELRRVLTDRPAAGARTGPGDPLPASPPADGTRATVDASQYDRAQWLKKLARVLDELPGSRAEWDELMYEARALELDPAWVAEHQRREFLLLVRRAVSDRLVTEAEHRKLDLARELIALPEAEAAAALHAIVAEAESFFGQPVREA